MERVERLTTHLSLSQYYTHKDFSIPSQRPEIKEKYARAEEHLQLKRDFFTSNNNKTT